MTKEEAKQRLHALNAAIATAVAVIKMEKATLDAFFEEQRSMDSVGPILDPTLWNSSERRVTEALLTPVYRAASDLVETYDGTVERSKAALEKVKG